MADSQIRLTGKVKIKRLSPTGTSCYQRGSRNFLTDELFTSVRSCLVSMGCEMTNAEPDVVAEPTANAEPDVVAELTANAESEPDDEALSVPDTDKDTATQSGNWLLVQRLGWRLRGDSVLQEADVRRAIADLGDDIRALRVFLEDRVAELAADPYISSKSRALQLQFVALGQMWFVALQVTPTLADYLESEAQVIDLEAILG